ncbi:hypothetical protein SRHO_G00279520 [Serrasalmus rhombeus]
MCSWLRSPTTTKNCFLPLMLTRQADLSWTSVIASPLSAEPSCPRLSNQKTAAASPHITPPRGITPQPRSHSQTRCPLQLWGSQAPPTDASPASSSTRARETRPLRRRRRRGFRAP